MQNKPIKTIFVCEFITAGGLNQQEIPASLLQQGALMRDALLHDLSTLPYMVYTTYDVRIAPPENAYYAVPVQKHDDAWLLWENLIKTVDAVWLIAPETDAALMTLTNLALKHKKRILGCGLNALKATSSKLMTYSVLDQAKIDTIPTHSLDDWQLGAVSHDQKYKQYLVKPDDGAGCEDTFIFNDATDLQKWVIENEPNNFVVQPLIEGLHGSISSVMYKGNAVVLSCNQQIIHQNHQQLYYLGNVVNGLQSLWEQCSCVAARIAQAITELNGYVGIDIIIEPESNNIIVVEINPRLTISYCRLREAMGYNPAEIIIDSLTKTDYKMPAIQKQQITFQMDPFND